MSFAKSFGKALQRSLDGFKEETARGESSA